MKAKSSSRSKPAPSAPIPPATDLLAMDEAIALLKTTRPTFYRWVRAGKLKGTKVGRQWRFRRSDVERFLQGEEPLIDLPVDIAPLLDCLQRRLTQAGAQSHPEPTQQAGVAQAVELMIRLAAQLRAGGLHLEPQPKGQARLRFRLDGVLQPIADFDLRLLPALLRQWKTMASCDVRESSRPQEGRLLFQPAGSGQEVDLRLTFLPAVLGEAMHARVLDPSSALLQLDAMSLPEPGRAQLLHWLDAPSGLIIVTGPTGCGKTSLLYACLNHLTQRRPERQAVTVEDPVEFLLPRTLQVPVKAEAGLSFPGVLRSVLKADADVILVGEIRDLETLNLALQSALNGHLVLTALHTSEAVSALQRMIDVGANPMSVAEATKLILAPRLVRRLCPQCAARRPPETALLDQALELARQGGLAWEHLPRDYAEPVGCPLCQGTGFHGRSLIAEVLQMTPRLSAAVVARLKTEDMRAIALNEGMIPLAAVALRRATEGHTSLGEALRLVTSIYR